MSKNKVNMNKMINELLRQSINSSSHINFDNGNNCTASGYLEKVEAQEKQHQQNIYNDLAHDLAMLGFVYQNDSQEIKKRVKALEGITAELTDFNRFSKKNRKSHSKKIAKLYRRIHKQQLELDKLHKRVNQLTKTVCLLAKYLDVSMSDDVPKINKKLERKIDKQHCIACLANNKTDIIDGSYRDVE